MAADVTRLQKYWGDKNVVLKLMLLFIEKVLLK